MFAFLKRLVLKPPAVSKPPTALQQAITDLNLINPYALRRVYSSDLSIFILNVPVNTVAKYIQLLEKANEGVKYDIGLFKSDFVFEYIRISVSDFFLTNNGYYLDNVIEVVEEFLTSVRSFLENYQALIESENCSPVNEHNRRVLGSLARNVIDIVDRFKEIR